MLIADGAASFQYGSAMEIYSDIQRLCENARVKGSVMERLALAIGLEHAVPIEQSNPKSSPSSSPSNTTIVDPMKRYLHYEAAFENGELDPSFATLTTWELRHVVNGDEPDDILTWGRDMLRNFRPDHILTSDATWRYVTIVRSEIRYGSQNVKYDRPELQKYVNILMNGGVCGRRAFFGRFILRAFGIPVIARSQTGHAALAHYITPILPSSSSSSSSSSSIPSTTTTTNDGGNWVVNLGGPWGAGYTRTNYKNDLDFRANALARNKQLAYLMVKRAQWAGDVMGETRSYVIVDGDDTNGGGGGGCTAKIGFWNGVAMQIQRDIIHGTSGVLMTTGRSSQEEEKVQEETLGDWCIVPTIAEKIIASPLTSDNTKITYNTKEDVITIPAASYNNKSKDILAMKSFTRSGGGDDGGGQQQQQQQIFLPSFQTEGTTIMRGGTWKDDANSCTSGYRMLSGGYGKYENWGFRVALSVTTTNNIHNANTPSPPAPQRQITISLGDSITTMELLYIQPGSFLMGGESTTDNKFRCVEVPKHQVTITHGFYIGKYPVTQQQYTAIQGPNPSKSTISPGCPVDTIGLADAMEFCTKLTRISQYDVRLPTEAEWEYASRGGNDTSSKWFFGDDDDDNNNDSIIHKMNDYAWFQDNAGGKSHPVGLKQPNPYGLYDVYGNVCERISDTYTKDYYSKSPRVDPMGPAQRAHSTFGYKVVVSQAGKYILWARMVTVNYDQRLNVNVTFSNDDDHDNDNNMYSDDVVVMKMPFTNGRWQESTPVTISLKSGENNLNFWRDGPPQYGLAIQSFMLVLV